MKAEEIRSIAKNKKARHDYFIEETYEAGIELVGTEVKSLRQGHCSIKQAFIRVKNGQVLIHGMHINPYEKGNIFNKDPLRIRKLLLHKYEISKIAGKINEQGYTLVPLEVYFKNGWAKLKLAVAKGKHVFDKREALKKHDLNREMEQTFKNKIRF